MKKEKIKEIYLFRILSGKNQAELAAMLGRSQAWVSRVETGNLPLTAPERVRIIRALSGGRSLETPSD